MSITFSNRQNRTPHELLEEAFGTLRELELHLHFFNLTFSSSLWISKVVMVGVTVLCGFSAIRMAHKNPVLGCLYVSMVLSAVIIYVGTFQFAYKVTERVEKLREVMEVTSARLVNLSEKMYWKMRLR